MSLIHQQEMTEKNLAAKRANGSMAQGPVTPEGKANSAAANLRHGFYCQAPNGALVALGEDQKDVKNEGRSDYVYENTGNGDKMSCEKDGFLQENVPIER